MNKIDLGKYSQIIIWGAGHLGTVLGAELIRRNMPLIYYWDLRAQNISECNGVRVYEPFSTDEKDENVLVIFGVSSGLIQEASLEKLRNRGYKYVQGMNLYQELICPQTESALNIADCCNRIECNVDTCSKLNQLIFNKYYIEDKVLLETGYLFITQRCSLRCKYCIAYMNSYKDEDRYDYPTERVLKDIDALSESCSYIKRVVVYGGEPFLHKGILEIVERLEEKNNIGIIDIVSNGIFKQPDDVLRKLNYKNLRIEFSNYDEALTKEQIDVRNGNLKKLKELGLNPFLHNVTPEWIKPRTFHKKEWTDDEKEKLKKRCDYFVASENNRIKQSMVIANGRFYPCRMACSVNTLGVADYPEDYISIDDYEVEDRITAINELYKKNFFNTCGHCESKQGEITQIAGEQGFDERYSLKH